MSMRRAATTLLFLAAAAPIGALALGVHRRVLAVLAYLQGT